MTIHPATAEDLLAAKKKGRIGDSVIDYVLEHGAAKVDAISRSDKKRIASNVRSAARTRGVKISVHYSANQLIVVKKA